MRVYVDTNIFIDWLTKRKYSFYATQFFQRSIRCEFILVISDLTILELQKHMSKQTVGEAPEAIRTKTKIVSLTKDDIKLAKTINIHHPDNIHVAVANKYSDVFLTNDSQILDLQITFPRTSSLLI